MSMSNRGRARLAVTVALSVGAVSAFGGLTAGGSAASHGKPLSGTLYLTPGAPTRVHGRSEYTGTYFRMLLPGKTDAYFSNANSRAADKTYTLLRPGTEHGLKLGGFQPPPSRAFSATGSALASAITLPETFESIKFSISTAPKDAQSGHAANAPALYVKGAKVTGDLDAWTAEWNKIYFNQGSPKPGDTYPGLTQPVTGTYNAKTRAITIVWYSLIVGGPFNGFTGYWHVQGTLKG